MISRPRPGAHPGEFPDHYPSQLSGEENSPAEFFDNPQHPRSRQFLSRML